MIKGPGGKTLDTYGSINDACQVITMFHDIARQGRQEPEQRQLGEGRRHASARSRTAAPGPYSSLHTGKYDVEDNFRLAGVRLRRSSPDGDWKAITPVENITGQ